ncbi:MAG: sigma-70 family RNA polymerase sigma factor [Actinomycetota bacterium]|nr:sigma-70 family RNA polymerase sigma factor [Actinomycetota bacterium]
MALAPTDVASTEEASAIRLVSAHRCGDREAFEEIVRTHYRSLLATARNRLGNPEDAKDAVQETLLRALLALDRFGDTGDWRLGAWLNTILIHVCADIPSRRKPTVPLSDWVAESHPDEHEQPASDHVALAAVQRAIARLPETQRRAFELRLVDGRPYEEVAGALGITETNARTRVRRARAALQSALESEDAVKGAWAAAPLVLAAGVRAALRRVLAGVGHPAAREAGAQALAASTPATGTSAASAIAGTPVQAGLQLLTQVSATPLGQAAVASATAAPGKGSVVLGIVASLATAGGLAAPAALSGSTATPTAPHTQFVSALPAATTSATPSSAGPSPSSSSSSASVPTTTSSTPSTTSGSPSPKYHFAAPAWLTLAATAAAYVVSAPATSSASSSSASSSSASTPTAPSSTSGATGTAGSTTSPPASSPAAASASSASASSLTGSAAKGASGTGATPLVTTSPTSSAPRATGAAVALPVGTCAGVTGFPGVTAPTSVPALSSSALDAILSTGSLSLATATGSPAFSGTALVKPTSGSTAPVHVRVGTCLAQGGSVLAVDLTGTTGAEVQLVGSLVAQPFRTSTGADGYLFRGNVTQLAGTALPGGRLPWGLPQDFVAEVQVQQAKTGSLTVVFLQNSSSASAQTASAPTSSAATTSIAGAPSSPTAAGTAPATASTATSTATTQTSPQGTAEVVSHPTTDPSLISGGSHTSI